MIITLLVLCLIPAYAQLIVTEHLFPIDTQPVEVIFNALEVYGGLAGYTGDVYAHTSVITNLSGGPSN